MVKDLQDDKYLREEVLKGFDVPADAELEVFWAADVELGNFNENEGWIKYDGALPEGGVQLTFYVLEEYAAEGDVVYILHYDKEKGEWDVQESVVKKDADGYLYIEGTFASLSPVAFLKATVKGEDGKPVNAKLEKKSPGTGL